MLRDRRLALASVMVATTLTPTPTPATTMSVAPCTETGWTSRSTASTATSAATTSSVMPFADGRQNLCPLHAERVRTRLGSRRQAQRDEGSRDGTDIGEHVPGVGQQGQGMREERRHHLESHEGGEEAESDGQVLVIGLR